MLQHADVAGIAAPDKRLGEHQLTVDGITKSFGERTAVDNVSFTIDAGETYGLLGPNGAGKTTAISMICGLLDADAGTVTLGHDDVTTSAVDVRGRIGYVPQEIAIYRDLSARENLRFFGRLHGLRGSELDSRCGQVLELLGLAARADERTENFSGGMQRRLNIGLGLLHEPTLLVLDEPTVGVDPQSRNSILDAVEVLSSEGMALLYTTHYMEEAERLCDRVGILDEGRMIAEGSRRELVAAIGELDHLRIEFAEAQDLGALDPVARVPGVHDVRLDGTRCDITIEDAAAGLPPVLQAAMSADATIRSVEVIEPDLEAVFLHLTGKALRDR